MAPQPFDMVFASLEDWDEVWRRNQFFVHDMASRLPHSRFLFVGLPRNVPGWLFGRSPSPFSSAVRPLSDCPNVFLAKALKWFPNSLEWGQSLNDQAMVACVRRAMESKGLRHPVLWINAHYCLPLVGALGEQGLVYDITDDWTVFAQSERDRQRVVEQDARLCRQADAVITCSQRLLELKQPLCPLPPVLIPNGVDLEHYLAGFERPMPADLERLPPPRVGYVGTVHSERVDVPLATEVARRLPQVSFVFIGPSFLTATEMDTMRQASNLHILGPRPYTDVPAYLAALDVCITPHRLTDFTESLNPIKLWEYLAVGKPIVSTPVAGFRDFPALVRLARGVDEFTDGVRQALQEGDRDMPLRRRQVAAVNSWKARVDAVMGVLERIRSQPVRV